jgi:hypothetical protein
MTGMAGDILPMGAPGHSALRFVRISNNSTIRAFAELNCVSYNFPIEMSLSLVNEHTLGNEYPYGFVAYEGDSRCPPQRQSSMKAASFCSLWQRRPMQDARVMEKLWCVMPCRQPTKRPVSDGPCYMPQTLGHLPICRSPLPRLLIQMVEDISPGRTWN